MKNISKIIVFCFLTALAFFLSCSQPQKKEEKVSYFSNAEFSILSLDTLPTPEESILQGKKPVKLGKPDVVPFKRNEVRYTYIKKSLLPPSQKVNEYAINLASKSKPLIVSKREMGRPLVNKATQPKSKDYNPYNLIVYGLNTGILDDKVHKTFQDSKGNLWFGSYKGVTQFNGTTNKQYTASQGFLDDFFVGMQEDSKGNLWFLFDREIELFDGKTLINFKFQPEDQPIDYFSDILIDKEGNIWVSSVENGVFKIDKDLKIYTQYGMVQGLSNNILCMSQDRKGNIWFGGEASGLFKWDGKVFSNYLEGLFDKTIFSIHLTGKDQLWLGTWSGVSKVNEDYIEHFVGLSESWTSSIFMDDNNKLWFSSLNKGIFYLDNNKAYNLGQKNGLYNDEAYHVMQDQAGYIWMSTVAGVAKYNRMLHTLKEEDGLVASAVRSLALDDKNNIWLGTEIGGLSYFDFKSQTFSNYNIKDGLPGSNVYSLWVDSDKDIWLGCYMGYLSKISADRSTITHYPSSGKFVVSIFQDHLGDIWFSTREKGGVFKLNKKNKQLTHYTTKQGLVADQVIKISQDAELNYVFATFKGVSFLSKDKKTICNYPIAAQQMFDIVESAYQDHTGAFWFGILADQGLIRLDRKTNKIVTFTKESGLPDNTVLGTIQDKNQNLWVSTRSGLTQISKYTLKHFDELMAKGSNIIFNSYTRENGYLDYGDGRHFILIDSSNRLWIPNANSLALVDASAKVKELKNMRVEIVSVKLFNESIAWKKDSTYKLANGMRIENLDFSGFEPWTGLPQKLKLAHNSNYLNFNFAAINTSSPKAVQYEYMLEGLDDQWNSPTYQTEVSYAKIPYGKYVFKVRGINSLGISDEEAFFEFEILPPFWQTWYAFLGYFILFALGLYFYSNFLVKQRLKKIKEREALRTKISTDLHDDVGSILTGLSMQSQMMSLNANETSKKQLLQLSDMSFEAMDRMRDTVWAIDPSRDRFENLIGKMRSFAEKTLPNKNIKHTFSIQVDSVKEFISPDKRQAVYLIFKEGITNILKHTDATMVEIVVTKKKNSFSLYMKDNGTMAPITNNEGQGLRNMALRASKINAELETTFNNGFEIELSFTTAA